MLARAFRFICLQLVRLFYPRIVVDGAERIPPDKPVLFVLNHPNGLLDPLVLMIGTRRQIFFLAKNTFWRNPLGRFCMEAFGALPVFRQRDEDRLDGVAGDRAAKNEQTFARCRALLRHGRALALFPEGTTHSGTSLLPLRAGAARIALSAEAENDWQLDLQVVPVGLWYSDKTLFRTSVLLAVGQPFDIKLLSESYSTDPEATIRNLTRSMEERLDPIVLQAENADLLRGITAVAAWTGPGTDGLTLEEHHEQAMKLLRGYERLHRSDPARLEAIAQHARRYADALRTLGVRDPWRLELNDIYRARLFGLFAWLLLGALPALVGAALSYWPYRLARPVALHFAGPYPELYGTVKLIAGAALILLWFIVLAVLCGMAWGAGWGVGLFLCMPAFGYIALRWGEQWRELRETLGYAWLYVRHAALVQELAGMRAALAAEISAAMQEVEAAPRHEERIHV
jgi:1-acyl-sn-glycerol-3-phosphate acyltransferase